MADKDESLENLGMDIFKSANFSNIVNEMKANLGAYLEMIDINAKMRMAKYNALVENGATVEQALAIVIGTQILG